MRAYRLFRPAHLFKKFTGALSVVKMRSHCL
jgi:hypothetical protein